MRYGKTPIVRRIAALLLACAALPSAAACRGREPGPDPVLKYAGLIHEPEFGGIYIRATIEEFNALGFAYGDSVDISFSNGYVLKDIPYYNGYYTDNGEPLLIAYPGYDYIKAAINNGDDLWEVAGLDGQDLWLLAGVSGGDTATVTLAARGRYQDVQNARDIHYKDDRTQFPSDEVFANFRAVTVGNIRSGALYRSASPCDNQHSRAPFADALIAAAGVRYVLDLADTPEKVARYLADDAYDTPYFRSLYEAGLVDTVGLNMNYGSDAFKAKVAAALTAAAGAEGPWLVHCTEGKDRTGFVCMLLEALCGASYREIVDDYMVTYDNYYKITEASDPARYAVIVDKVLHPMLRALTGTGDPKTADLAAAAADYLRAGGMTDRQIGDLIACLTG